MNDLLMFLLFMLTYLVGVIAGMKYESRSAKTRDAQYQKVVLELSIENEKLTKALYENHVEKINQAWKERMNRHATDRT